MKLNATILALLLTLIAGSATAGTEDYSGVMTVDSITARPGESFGLKVWLRNNTVDISGMTLPIKFPNPQLHLDSVSLASSVWTHDFAGYYHIDNIAKVAKVTVIPAIYSDPLPDVDFTEGVVAEFWFTLALDAQATIIPVDSVYSDEIIGGVHVYNRIDVTDNTGTSIYLPDFIPGEITVFVPTGVDDDPSNSNLPTEFALAQNYPNPFNPSTVIAFALPTASHVRLDIYNILGQNVITLADCRMDAGRYEVTFEADDRPSGIYFYRLTHSEGTLTRKMLLVK